MLARPASKPFQSAIFSVPFSTPASHGGALELNDDIHHVLHYVRYYSDSIAYINELQRLLRE